MHSLSKVGGFGCIASPRPSRGDSTSATNTCGHTQWKTRDPVRSPNDKPLRAGVVVGSVTTGECLVLHVHHRCIHIFCFFGGWGPKHTLYSRQPVSGGWGPGIISCDWCCERTPSGKDGTEDGRALPLAASHYPYLGSAGKIGTY
ncbi:hypothetical protein K456DRAFT_1934172 [Colletotrichum gloeosporioides 23]|nr:hypothetical protein K456DRAFT_1934172 [Colletotrichum gloeosporioides 23]